MSTSITCQECNGIREAKPSKDETKAKLPKGWKRFGAKVYCQACVKSKYVLRAISFPVASVVEDEWKDFTTALAEQWGLVTSFSNWSITELAKRDIVRTPDLEKLPAMQPVYLYPEARKRFPALDSGIVASLEQAIQSKYKKLRYEAIWTAATSLPRFKYPVPCPIRKADWQALFGKDNVPLVKARFGGHRWTIRLRGGSAFKYQLAGFKQIESGEAEPCELALYRQIAHSGDNRAGTEDRQPGGGQRTSYRIMCKIAAWFPKRIKERNGTLQVKTGPDCFLCAGASWVVNGDHIRRHVIEHRKRLDRLAQDQKAELRQPRRKRIPINEHRKKLVEKQKNRLDSFCHETSAHLANYAARQGVASVEYDDTDKSYLAEFPWYRLKEMIRYKLDERGISLVTKEEASEAVQDK